jgi:hypothetical protein
MDVLSQHLTHLSLVKIITSCGHWLRLHSHAPNNYALIRNRLANLVAGWLDWCFIPSCLVLDAFSFFKVDAWDHDAVLRDHSRHISWLWCSHYTFSHQKIWLRHLLHHITLHPLSFAHLPLIWSVQLRQTYSLLGSYRAWWSHVTVTLTILRFEYFGRDKIAQPYFLRFILVFMRLVPRVTEIQRRRSRATWTSIV